jgi:hypothetical protein
MTNHGIAVCPLFFKQKHHTAEAHLAIYIQNWMIAGSSHGGLNGGFHTWGVPHIIYDEKNIEIDDLGVPPFMGNLK